MAFLFLLLIAKEKRKNTARRKSTDCIQADGEKEASYFVALINENEDH